MEARWIARHLPVVHAERIVDLGCGNGGLFPFIGERRVVGLDSAMGGLCRTAGDHPSVRLACGSAMQLPLADGCVDALTAQHVIEHLPDADAALREWRRVLRPGGVVVLVTPNAAFCDPRVFDDPTHVCTYRRTGLCRLLTRAGFLIDDVITLALPWFRRYAAIPGGWRLRRAVLQNAAWLGRLPFLRNAGQSLCCVARKAGGR